ncbi:MAG: beta-lactamase family protein, partial [Desulfobacterales bacterium]|nr:beta-lactamase family protein [Desulfobacterales bacterium]
DPVAEFIPDFKEMRVLLPGTGADMGAEPARNPITIHHLLTHTSGLTYGFGNTDDLAKMYTAHRTDFDTHDGPLYEVTARLAKLPLAFHPGDRWNYSISFDVLGRLVEVISGLSYDEFLKRRIFEPLKMVDTGFAVPSEKASRFAALYERTGDDGMTLSEAPASSPMIDSVETFAGGAGLVSTVGDYFRFTELLRRKGELDGERLLGRKTVEYMTTNHMPGDLAAMGQETFNETTYEGVGFGLGVSVMLDPAKARIMGSPGEYAWGGAASTAFWIDPAEDMTVIFLTQLMPSSAYPIRRELRVLTYQALL